MQNNADDDFQGRNTNKMQGMLDPLGTISPEQNKPKL